jgi:hypothetical protein
MKYLYLIFMILLFGECQKNKSASELDTLRVGDIAKIIQEQEGLHKAKVFVEKAKSRAFKTFFRVSSVDRYYELDGNIVPVCFSIDIENSDNPIAIRTLGKNKVRNEFENMIPTPLHPDSLNIDYSGEIYEFVTYYKIPLDKASKAYVSFGDSLLKLYLDLGLAKVESQNDYLIRFYVTPKAVVFYAPYLDSLESPNGMKNKLKLGEHFYYSRSSNWSNK